MSRIKFKGTKKATDGYDYVSFNLFGKDKEKLTKELNSAKAQYSSIAHFVRCAINRELKSLKIDFRVSEQ